jgi:hypothetical protein
MQRQNDWIYLTFRRIDVRTMFWIRCARWICHLCLIKSRFWITKWIKENFNVNKRHAKIISKLSTNRANINHKEDNRWSICHIAEQNLEWEDDWSRKKNQRNSRIENPRIASSTIVSVYAKRNTRSMIVFIWSRTFAWLNKNQMIKSWKKIEKILEANLRVKNAIKYVRKKIKRRFEKIIENANDSNDESSKKKCFFDDKMTLNVSFAEAFAKEQVS